MSGSRILVILICGAMVSLSSQAVTASDGWHTPFKQKSIVKKMKRKGMFPVSATCRNSPKAKVTIKPEIKVVWRKNTAKRAWQLYVYKGQLDFKPYPTVTSNQWRRVYSKIMRSGGATYRCSLWHAK